MVAVQGANMDCDLDGRCEGRILADVCAYWVDADVCPVHRSEAEMEVDYLDSVSLM